MSTSETQSPSKKNSIISDWISVFRETRLQMMFRLSRKAIQIFLGSDDESRDGIKK